MTEVMIVNAAKTEAVEIQIIWFLVVIVFEGNGVGSISSQSDGNEPSKKRRPLSGQLHLSTDILQSHLYRNADSVKMNEN